jgi:hypothetical protein
VAGLPSSSVCIRLPPPAGLIRLGFRKSRSWRLELDPQALRRQQRLALGGLDPSLRCLVCCVQPLIRRVGFRLYALDDSGRRGFVAARLEARPKHLGPCGERCHHGQHRECKQYPSQKRDLDPGCLCSTWAFPESFLAGSAGDVTLRWR